MKKIDKNDLRVDPIQISFSLSKTSTITKNEFCDTNFYTCHTRAEVGCQSGNACETKQHCETNDKDCNTKYCETKVMGDGCLTMIENECATFVGANCDVATQGQKCPTTTNGLDCDQETYPCISVGCVLPTQEHCENTDNSEKLCCTAMTDAGTICIPNTRGCKDTEELCLIQTNVCHLSLNYCQPGEPIDTTLCNQP